MSQINNTFDQASKFTYLEKCYSCVANKFDMLLQNLGERICV